MEFQILYFTHFVLAVTVIITFMAFNDHEMFENFLFSTNRIIHRKEYHRFFTATLIHADWIHLFFNMFTLYSFASFMEPVIGWIQMFLIYIVSGLAGDGLAFLIKRKGSDYRAVGASGAVLGVVFASVFLFPGGEIYMFFIPIPIPDWVYAILFIGISFYGIRAANSNIGHEAHLGGAIAGMILAVILEPMAFFANMYLFIGLSLLILVFLGYILKQQHQ